MIFVTVGSQMPFDRLIRVVDEWALSSGVEVVAQVGQSSLTTKALVRHESLQPQVFAEYVRKCELLVGHAGMGTVLLGHEYRKPMVLMPRRGDLQETRNDHQTATLKWLANKPGIYAAFDEQMLLAFLEQWRAAGLPQALPEASLNPETERLVSALQHFIRQ